MYMIIYKTTNLVNGKIYIGKDSINDPQYFGSGLILNNAIKKYGINHFRKDILEKCTSPQELNEREKYWIKKLNSTDRRIGYNIAKGGDGGDIYSHLSDARKRLVIKKRMSTRPLWDTPEYRQKLSKHTKKLWENPAHRDHIVKVMTGRKIHWKDKIGKSNKRFWEINGDVRSEESKRHVSEINRQKMTGKEFKSVTDDVKQKIISLYQIYGPKLISNKLMEEGIEVSRYVITRVLKKEGIYQRWQKGIGEKSHKHASISRCGIGNPMSKQRMKQLENNA